MLDSKTNLWAFEMAQRAEPYRVYYERVHCEDGRVEGEDDRYGSEVALGKAKAVRPEFYGKERLDYRDEHKARQTEDT
jgi:hypothetical protein